MPTIEAITPKENRDFLTSLGDWVGDGTWMESGLPEIFGYMRFDTEDYEEEKGAHLGYPYIAPGGGYDNLLRISLGRQNWEYEGDFYWSLTDGVYTFEDTVHLPLDPNPISVETHIDIPPDWTKKNSLLEIRFTSLYSGAAYWLATRFTLEYYKPTKPQYLPIMGVG